MTKKTRFAVGLAALVLALVVAIASYFIPAARVKRAANACINNLRQIDGAKQQWALENNKTADDTPSWDAVRPFLGRGDVNIPRCPQGGVYILGRIAESPKCSIGGSAHSLPQYYPSHAEQDH